MSWKSGVKVARDLWCELVPLLPPEHREEAARRMSQVFEDYDCGITADELLQLGAAGQEE